MMLAGGICKPTAGHYICQIDTCARDECFAPWSAGKCKSKWFIYCIYNSPSDDLVTLSVKQQDGHLACKKLKCRGGGDGDC